MANEIKMDVDGFLAGQMTGLETVAENLGFRIEGDKVIPKGTVSVQKFKDALGEYIAEELSAGNNPGYILDNLYEERSNIDDFKDYLYDGEEPFDE